MNKEKVLVIGSGPIIIGQSCEFDYSGTQACKAARELGYEVVLINSNPATIMTDPKTADYTYICDTSKINEIIKKEKPKYILPIVGGQTALNAAENIDKDLLNSIGCKLIGSDFETILNCEDREFFRQRMLEIGLYTPRFYDIHSIEDLYKNHFTFPVIVKPSFVLGGMNVTNCNDLKELINCYIKLTKNGTVSIEQSIYGWQELEIEIIRDSYNNKVIVCTIENVDPVGIHTGDSVCVSPFITVPKEIEDTIKEYSKRIVEKLNIIGGCNIQFAYNNKTNELLVIEVNPRTSRSSALASKATGFPIAYISTKLALGEELPDDIKKYEQGNGYFAVKFPRFNMEKFDKKDDTLGMSMKATGEVLSFGKTFGEAYKKALFSLEKDINAKNSSLDDIKSFTSKTYFQIADLLKQGVNPKIISDITHIHPYFINEIKNLDKIDLSIKNWYKVPVVCDLDKFYYYSSSVGNGDNIIKSNKKKVLVIGSGANRIGQGIEFDYSCIHAIQSLKRLDYEVLIINCNPETVSTDYDIADQLYFEPITIDTLKAIYEKEKPEGVLIQFGGQTALNLYKQLKDSNINVLDMDWNAFYNTENREAFRDLMKQISVPIPQGIFVSDIKSATAFVNEVGFPVIARPSYIIGGSGIKIIRNQQELIDLFENISGTYIDKYLEGFKECDIDILTDGKDFVYPTIIDQELVGVHTGDSVSRIPDSRYDTIIKNKIDLYIKSIIQTLNYKGILNIQFAYDRDEVYIIEINLRCSRTVPILSKVYNYDMVSAAIDLIFGKSIFELEIIKTIDYTAIKIPVFCWNKFPFTKPNFGPEMHSVGEKLEFSKQLSLQELYK